MQEYEIEFYDKPDGSEPAKEFILSLDKKMQAKVLRTVALLREEGPFLREPYSKALDDGIFEIRTKFGSDITRVLYFFVIGKRVILTNGFIKKTQKTPASEITLAKQYRIEYLTRKENSGSSASHSALNSGSFICSFKKSLKFVIWNSPFG